MTDTDRRTRWWADLDAVDEPEGVGDPWPADGNDIALSADQVRFLESLADQPRVPRLSAGLPGVEDPGINPADETGD